MILGLWPIWDQDALARDHIIVEPVSGLALFGVDPVAYFIDGQVRHGIDTYELRYEGYIWQFANLGNLEAFKAAPEVYMPQYGGHGALAVARGFPATGNPAIWQIWEGKLYLFFSLANKIAWNIEIKAHVISAGKKWPHIESQLGY